MSTASKATPRLPTGRPQRLDSLKNPLPRTSPQTKRQSRTQRLANSRECPNADCTDKDVGEEDGQLVCRGCGTVVNDSNMVSEVLFGAASNGAHMVHGAHVGADQTFARSAVLMRTRAGGAMDTREMTEATGRRYVNQLGAALTVSQSLIDSGMQIFKLAAANNFIQGRRTKSVAAVCLYIACRIQKDTNRIMLIDFSDVLMLNVFKLGHIYKDLIEELRINGNGFTVQPINPEDLILRFCYRLEFGDETMRVANDAVRIVQRFNRDWMTPGRRPAGICGAAIILAARMNNFRRTTRELVYVVKVTEPTLQKRLDEFKYTESSGLTVEEFRTIDLEHFCDPPAFYGPKGGKKKIRKRKMIDLDDDGSSGNESHPAIASNASSAADSHIQKAPSSLQKSRLDSQTMPPPPIPIDPALVQVPAQRPSELQTPSTANSNPPIQQSTVGAPPKPKRGRPSKKSKATEGSSTSTGLNSTDPESDLTSLISPPSTFASATALQRVLETTSDIPAIPAKPRRSVPDTEIIAEEEFGSDVEVKNCLLTPAEVAIKERIWTHENRDYIRAQQNKLIKQQLAEENGTARVIVRRKRRRGRMGDMSAYREEGDDANGDIASSPAEAAMKMLKKRAYSKKINYETLKKLYEPSTPSSANNTDSNASASASRRPSAASRGSETPETPSAIDVEISSPGRMTAVEKILGSDQVRKTSEAAEAVVEEGDDDAHEVGDPDFWDEGELEGISGAIDHELDEDEDVGEEEEYEGEEYD